MCHVCRRTPLKMASLLLEWKVSSLADMENGNNGSRFLLEGIFLISTETQACILTILSRKVKKLSQSVH